MISKGWGWRTSHEKWEIEPLDDYKWACQRGTLHRRGVMYTIISQLRCYFDKLDPSSTWILKALVIYKWWYLNIFESFLWVKLLKSQEVEKPLAWIQSWKVWMYGLVEGALHLKMWEITKKISAVCQEVVLVGRN